MQQLESNGELSIVRLGDLVSADQQSGAVSQATSFNDSQGTGRRGQKSSRPPSDVLESTTPAVLEEDLVHYKELFSKLRFSYVEQVTKERYLRGIVGDPPVIVGSEENQELEAKLAESKAELKQRKEEIAQQLERVGTRTRDLANRQSRCLLIDLSSGMPANRCIAGHESLKRNVALLSDLPSKISALEEELQTLSEAAAAAERDGVPHDDPGEYRDLSPGELSKTLQAREAEAKAAELRLASANTGLAQAMRRIESTETELEALQREKEQIEAALRGGTATEEAGRARLMQQERRYQRTKEILEALV
ncbi:hypothetical protein KEM52_005362 [Ascosphaera acerosa]|nr:hypothetical protein KEM52_005362 [Ascosphaera acerosa]